MNQDNIDRDRLLTEVATNVKYLVESHRSITQALVDHARVDDTRFGNIDETLKKMNVTSALFYGKIYGGSAVIGAFASVVIKLIFP